MKACLGAAQSADRGSGGWSTVRGAAHGVMQDCLQGWDSGLVVQGEPDRYSPPAALCGAPSAAQARACAHAEQP
eukprot:13740733-Alexandrium_andersonii.AAC.1